MHAPDLRADHAVFLASALLLCSCYNGDAWPLNKPVALSSSKPLNDSRPKDKLIVQEEGAWVGNRALPLTSGGTAANNVDGPNGRASVWTLSRGETVAAVIRRWADEAGYVPLPKFAATENWNVIVDEQFTGNFEEALGWLSDGFARQSKKPVAILFANRTIDLIAVPSAKPLTAEMQKADYSGTMLP